MQIKEYYAGKTILLSGTTGFIGKVVLEKLLRSLPTIKRIYIMVRAKKSMTVEDRMMQTIFTSEIFSRVWKEQPGLFAQIRNKVVPIAGDLVLDGLGMSQQDRQRIVKECNIIINCAASVNFDDPILDAIQINYLGCQRCLKLAQECENIETFTHVSTAYVNSNRESGAQIEEEVYDLPQGQDAEEIIAKVLKLNPQQCNELEKQLIGAYPNTYTYSKSMAERMLKKTHGNLRVTICRPSIVISCQDEPLKGWTETLSAAGGLTFAVSMGLCNLLQLRGDQVLDIIPCDFVSNMIICATVYAAKQPPGYFKVCHSATSHLKPLTINIYKDGIFDYLKYNPFTKQIFEPHITFCDRELEYQARQQITQKIPMKALSFYAKATKNAPMEKQVDELMKINTKMDGLMRVFTHFINNSWIYKQTFIDTLWPKMSPQEQQEFNCNVRLVNWNECLATFAYGIRRYYMREDCVQPNLDYQQIIMKNNHGWFTDVRYAASIGIATREKQLKRYYHSVMSPHRFQDYLQMKMGKLSHAAQQKNDTVAQEQSKHLMPLMEQDVMMTFQSDKAKQQLQEMDSNITKQGVRALIWFMNKVTRLSVQGLYINNPSIQRVKSMISEGKRVILMPLYKSLVDAFIMTYSLNHFGLEQPFIFGNLEDSPRISYFDAWLAQCGYIKQRRHNQQNVQSWYVNAAIMKEAIEDNALTVVYQNAARPRTGKLHSSNHSDLSIQWILDAYLNMSTQGKNMHIVPVMVSYDRIFETKNLTNEMISGEKKLLSQRDFVSRFSRFKKDQLGEIYMDMLEPINVQEYLNQNGFKNFKFNMLDNAALKLSKELYTRQATETPVTLNSIVSAFILLEKTTTMSVQTQELLKKSVLIFNYIKQKQHIKCFMNIAPQAAIIEKHAEGLGFIIKNKGKKDSTIHIENMHKDWRIQMCLAHYSLSLSSAFVLEYCFAHLIHTHFNILDKKEPMYRDVLLENGKKLVNLFDKEHLYKYEFNMQTLDSRLKFFTQGNILTYDEKSGEIMLNKDRVSSGILEFWASMAQVYLDSYLAVLMSLEYISSRNIIVKRKHIVFNLRKAIKILYADKVLPYVHSCLAELLHTGLQKYSEMKLIEINSYGNKKGSTTPYLIGNTANRALISEQLAFMISLGHRTEEQIKRMEDQVATNMTLATGPQKIAKL